MILTQNGKIDKNRQERRVPRMKKREASVDILDKLSWTVQPPMGLLKGDYYRAENWFAPHYDGDEGYHGILEVVCREGKILHVEFTEYNSPSYYIQKYQNVSKRRSDYCFFQATKARTAVSSVVLANGITHLEEQMVAQNRLTGDFDLLTGASNSIRRSMLPLAEELAAKLGRPSGVQYYGLAREVEKGVTGRLQLEWADGRILSSFYDEIFADWPQDIADEELKPYYRQSKYNSLEYLSTIGIGFNHFSDMISQRVGEAQSLTELGPLPFTQGDAKCTEWEHYLVIASALQAEMKRDGLSLTA